jgi:hypothetical protein
MREQRLWLSSRENLKRTIAVNIEDKADNKTEKDQIIALGTTLHLKIDGGAEGFKGVLVGIVPNEYLIIKGQFYEIEHKSCKESETIVRYVHEGIVYKFSSLLLGVISTPVELGFLTYPEEIETIELRSHKRTECFFPAELIIRNEKYQVVIQEVSEGGCKFKAKLPKGEKLPAIKKNDPLTLMAQLSGKEDAQTILGEARHIQFLSDFDTEEMYTGVKFHEPGPQELKTNIEHNGLV